VSALEPQLWLARNKDVSCVPSPARFKPVSHDSQWGAWVKPHDGGLWTSTYDNEYGSAWVQFCLSETYEIDRENPTWQNCWLLDPDPEARVYVIDDYPDLDWLIKEYGHTRKGSEMLSERMTFPDWVRMSEDYDAVHMTEEGQWKTRLSHPHNLYGWDCECTLWLRWRFIHAQRLGELVFAPKNPWWEEVTG
jgi:hypothetical protein